MFKFTSSDKTWGCCYIKYPTTINDSMLCDPEGQNDRMMCREKMTYQVVEKKIGYVWQLCILHIFNFRPSDVGEYKAVFLRKTEDNRRFEVMQSDSGLSGGAIAGACMSVSVALVLSALFFFFCLRPWWERRQENRWVK
jgi:hypothetical protein